MTPEGSLALPAVFSAVQLLAGSVASLPLILYRRTPDGGRVRATEHPLYRLLHMQPNPRMAAFTFKEALQASLLLWGNAYALVDWGPDGRPRALWPIRPDIVRVELNDQGQVLYRVQTRQGEQVLVPEQVLHIVGLSFDGLKGLSPIAVAREAIGAGLATQEYGARFFGNGALPGVVLKYPGTLSDKAMANLRASWNALHQGVGNAHRVAILEEGIDIATLSIPPEDAQFIETKKFAVADVARIFRVPPHLLYSPDGSISYASVEVQSLEFLTYSLRPWLARWEEALTTQLLTEAEQAQYYVEFQTNDLVRADIKTRFGAYKEAIEAGWLSPNEVRRYENLPPFPGGDTYLMPINTTPLGSAAPQGQGQGRSAGRLPETRAEGTPLNAVIDRYRPKVREAVAELLRRERDAVMGAVQEAVGRRSADTAMGVIRDWYSSMPDWATEIMTPAFAALVAETIRTLNKGDWPADEQAAFVAAMVADYLAQHAGISRATLEAALAENPVDALKALGVTFDTMVETMPDKAAKLRTVDAVNQAALESFRRAGVTKVRWVAGPGSCDYCLRLNGKVVGLGEAFIQAGEQIPGPEGDMSRPFIARAPRVAPPVHLACNCTLAEG